LVLVRHGQGVCNAAAVIGGQIGCRGLSERGWRESVRLAERLAELARMRTFDVLLSSPRPRVLQCAQIIGARLDMAVIVVDALRGQEFGAADGQPWEQVTSSFGGPPADHPERAIADGAEPWNAYAERVLEALTAVLAAQAGGRILLVGHGKTIGLASALLSGAVDPRAAAPGLVIDHGALSHWRQGPGRWDLEIHDDSRHLTRSGLPESAGV
jgi:probable phosphoglycerate mutase